MQSLQEDLKTMTVEEILTCFANKSMHFGLNKVLHDYFYAYKEAVEEELNRRISSNQK